MEEEVTSSFPVLTTSDAIVLVNDFGITAELHAIQVSLTTRHFAWHFVRLRYGNKYFSQQFVVQTRALVNLNTKTEKDIFVIPCKTI